MVGGVVEAAVVMDERITNVLRRPVSVSEGDSRIAESKDGLQHIIRESSRCYRSTSPEC